VLWNWGHHGANEGMSKKFQNKLQLGDFIFTEVNVNEKFTNKSC